MQASKSEPKLQKLGLDISLANDLQVLVHSMSKHVSDDETQVVREEEDIFTTPPLKYEQNNDSESIVKIPINYISKLPLSYSFTTDIVAALSHNHVLKNVTISDTEMNETKSGAEIEGYNHGCVSRIFLSHDWLGGNGSLALTLALCQSCSIQELNLNNDGFKALASALHQNSKTFGRITVSVCGIKDSGAADLAQALREDHCFQKITLSESEVSGAVAAVLLQSLINNSSLQEFSLTNQIGSSKHRIFCRQIEDTAVPQTLLKPNFCLFLSCVNIIKDGAVALANILHKCSSFSCMCNIDDDDGMTHIIQGLSNNSTFQSIDLSHIKIDCERAAALSQLLHGTTLQELTLSYSKLGDNEVTEISQNLKQNCTLKRLSLSGKNSISHNGTLVLACALKQNSALQELILHDVHIGDNGTKAI